MQQRHDHRRGEKRRHPGSARFLWWWYFDGASGGAEQPVRNQRDAIRFHVWSYAHFPLYLGIVVASVGVQRIVTAAAHEALTPTETSLMGGAVAVIMLAMATIGAAAADRRPPTPSRVVTRVLLAAAMLAIGLGGGIESPLVLIVVILALCAAQLGLSLAGSPANRSLQGAAAVVPGE